MNKNIISLALLLGMTLSPQAADAVEVESRIFNKSGNETWCTPAAPRQTVIYVDETDVVKGDNKWALQILNKLRFTAHERVQILALKPDQGTTELRFSLCYPDYSAAELEDLRNNQSLKEIFTGTPLDQMKQAREQFDRGFRVALSSFINGGRGQEMIAVQPSALPQKSIAEALFYDEKRFAIENGVSRLIIFSDMLQNSATFTPAKTEKVEDAALASAGTEPAKTYSMKFNMAEVHVFGIGASLAAADPLNRRMESFWRAYLLSNGAYLEQFSNTLSMGDARQINVLRWRGALTLPSNHNLHTEVSLRLMTDETNSLVNSWLLVNGVGSIPLEGKARCTDGGCDISASLRADMGEFKKNDILGLRGSAKEVKGALRDPKGGRFPNGQPAEYEIGVVRDEVGRF